MKEKTAANGRFRAGGGVTTQTVLWEFGSLSPATTLHASYVHICAFFKREKCKLRAC
jgi:hypothetical protein